MQDFINFVVDNWQFVSTSALSVVSFILLLVFRRSKSVLIDDGFYHEILKLVIEAENLFGSGHGKEKFDYVFTKVVNTHQSLAVISFDGLSKMIERAVDDVLTSPQKKGK